MACFNMLMSVHTQTFQGAFQGAVALHNVISSPSEKARRYYFCYLLTTTFVSSTDVTWNCSQEHHPILGYIIMLFVGPLLNPHNLLL